VFSNPVADQDELDAFYDSQYYESIEEVYGAGCPDLEQLVRQRSAEEVKGLSELILPYVSSGMFFEIGAGYGNLLEAARQLGFTVAGVEPSRSAARFARETFGLEGVKHGMFEPNDWPREFCDVVYAYHVIEHVPDVNQFIEGVLKILRPGGVVYIGTENHHNSWVVYRRVRSWLKGQRLPEFQTSDHHTFYFCDKSLRHLFEKGGFEVIKTLVYTRALEDKLKSTRFRSPFSKAFFYLLHYSDVWTGRGNRLLIWCRKPGMALRGGPTTQGAHEALAYLPHD
jgi:2-polyprenyl-3-methyl-5-hydroxy-6-metoxy-1,4-benzoquinol methylase